MASQAQTIPVRVYRGEKHIMLAAPLPGLEPKNISVTITGDTVRIQGDERGPGQRDREMIIEEWAIGPYEREVQLPEMVDAELTNATYGNGILVLAMPSCKHTQGESHAAFQLHPIDATRGERIGHSGMNVRAKAAAQHDKKHKNEKGGEAKISSR